MNGWRASFPRWASLPERDGQEDEPAGRILPGPARQPGVRRWPVSLHRRSPGRGHRSRCRPPGRRSLATRTLGRPSRGARVFRPSRKRTGSRASLPLNPSPGFPSASGPGPIRCKGKPVAVEGDLSAAGMRFAIVVARWNAVITERLLEGALDALLRSGAARADIEVVRVPGAWEIPAAARTLANRARWTPSLPSVACCAAKPLTTKPSTTKWRAASASRSRRPAFPTALACSPARPWSRPSTAPASRPETRALRPPPPPSRWSACAASSQSGGGSA